MKKKKTELTLNQLQLIRATLKHSKNSYTHAYERQLDKVITKLIKMIEELRS